MVALQLRRPSHTAGLGDWAGPGRPTCPRSSRGGTSWTSWWQPLVGPRDQGGAIDRSTFGNTDGSRYLLWKNDGNRCGLDTWLQIAPLSRDGQTLSGASTKLIKQTASWEGSLIEAPMLLGHGPTYFLFYSANNYADGSYATGCALAPALTGP